MKLFTTCTEKLEDYSKLELENLGFTDIIIRKGCCIVAVKSYEDIIRFSYISSLTRRCGLLLMQKKISPVLKENENKLKEVIKKLDLEEFFEENTEFRIETLRKGEHEFNSSEFERFFGGLIYDELEIRKLNPKVNLKNPSLNIYSQIIDDELIVGVDFIGFDSNKRDYKIFSNSHSIRGDLGQVMVLEGLKSLKKGVLLDPFASDGVIGIEAALKIYGKSHNYYRKKDFLLKKLKKVKNIDHKKIFSDCDKKETKDSEISVVCYDSMLSNVKSIQKNSKIAGIDKKIKVSKIEIDFLDIKFKEDTIDGIISVLPKKSRDLGLGKLKKIIDKFFYQAKFILKKDSNIILLSEDHELVEISKNYDFKIIKQIKLKNNRRSIYVLSL